jgi:putative nucleotidyltransferase with HDIG domain
LKAAGYISSNRTHELEREVELKIQKERIMEFCAKNSLELVKIYEEPSDSRDDYKPALLKLLNEASDKTFEKVVIFKYDYLGKDSLVKNWVIDELKKSGITVKSLIEENTGIQISNDKDTEDKIKSKTESIKQKVRDIPSLPEVVTKVMELVQNPNSSAAQLSRIISHDPGLTSRVLRLVNSAYYGFPKQISSIQHAVMILGFTTMRGLVLSSSIFKIFTPKSGDQRLLDYRKFWKHSLISAICAKNINSYLRLMQDEDIFSSAILHDIGKIILDQYDHENYTKAYSKVLNQIFFDQVLNAEKEFCSVDHQETGFMIADGWNLPESISEVIRYHHNPLEAENNKVLTSVVYIANILSYCLIDALEIKDEMFDSAVMDYLGVSIDDIYEMLIIVNDEVENMGDLESFFK